MKPKFFFNEHKFFFEIRVSPSITVTNHLAVDTYTKRQTVDQEMHSIFMGNNRIPDLMINGQCELIP